MTRNVLSSSRPALALVLLAALQAHAAPAPTPDHAAAAKVALTHADYIQWRTIATTAITADGRHVAYALANPDADGALIVRRLEDGHEWRIERGMNPVFSADGQFLAFTQAVPKEEADKARRDKKKPEEAPKPGAGWLRLSDGHLELMPRVKRWAFAEQGGRHLAVLLEAALPALPAKAGKAASAKDDTWPVADDRASSEEISAADQSAPPEAGAFGASTGERAKKEPGTELLLIDPANGQRLTFRDVASFQWARKGQGLAFAVSVKEPAKEAGKEGGKLVTAAADAPPQAGTEPATEGVYWWPAGSQDKLTLLQGPGHYKQLAVSDDGRRVAFVTNRDGVAEAAAAAKAKPGQDKAGAEAPRTEPASVFKVMGWQQGEAQAKVLLAAGQASLAAGHGPSEHAALRFSKDGERLFLGTAPLPVAEPKNQPEPLKVDLWHHKDPELQPMQKVKAEREKLRSFRGVLHWADGRFVQLASTTLPEVMVNENAAFAVGYDETPYRPLQSWDSLYRDVYAIDLQTGQARLLAKKQRGYPRLSPKGRYITAFQPDTRQWTAWESATGKAINLTGAIKGRHFENVDRDVVEPSGPYGQVGWLADDRAVVLQEQYDLFSVEPATGRVVNLTQDAGKRAATELRYQALAQDDQDDGSLPQGPWLLLGKRDKDLSSAIFRLTLAGGQGTQPQLLKEGAKLYGGFLKAKRADTLLYTQQSFEEFPDLWQSDLSLAQAKRISHVNPQQARFRWGTQELVTFKTADGQTQRAVLTKPEDFDPKKKYPLMVYIYEKMTDNLHRHAVPAPGQNINPTRYVSNGYLVLRPDISYTIGHPGQSALKTVVPAVKQLIRQGIVDGQRVGIQGHSWGAYQVNYLITQTTLFRAAEAGASMANMVSGYGGIRWGTGMSRAFQYEQQQSRMKFTPWERPDLYVENSPIFHIHKVKTPYLTVHNDEDDAVPYYQAIEFVTALRRLGKEAYWFNYNGEKHGLRDRDAIRHFTVHMTEFFDHHLKDAPRPEWMDKPVPYLERGKRDVNVQFKLPGGGPRAATPASAAPAAAPASSATGTR